MNRLRAASTTAARERTTRGSASRLALARRAAVLRDIALISALVYRLVNFIGQPDRKRATMVPAPIKRPLLGYGILVGPFYLALGIGQGLVRDGFSFARHPLSVLANGPGGWLQTANLAVSGLMVLAAVVGIARVAGQGSRGMR